MGVSITSEPSAELETWAEVVFVMLALWSSWLSCPGLCFHDSASHLVHKSRVIWKD
jgi:hypothetical protein